MNAAKSTTHQIDNLVFFLKESKASITKYTRCFNVTQLDYEIDEDSNSIGTLLKHMAAMEYHFQLRTFENRIPNADERIFWKGALQGELIQKTTRKFPIEYYTNLWDSVREVSYAALANKDDRWLDIVPKSDFEEKGSFLKENNHYCWYHLIEDHICHLGQIKLINKSIKINRIK